ncbi:uncharacterized protein LOC114318279 isoform X3 [Camellia sinensis]|uniref:uncharacterized protein LOC114318279 isoform X3 n=1 Tax=Camellia sinensis TaxID=4442 RepID=UPI00103582B1|nr:uncharacterized protein LOC114318279 isoform X3 [Camellia sinensis]
MELLLELGLQLGQCHLIRKGHGSKSIKEDPLLILLLSLASLRRFEGLGALCEIFNAISMKPLRRRCIELFCSVGRYDGNLQYVH